MGGKYFNMKINEEIILKQSCCKDMFNLINEIPVVSIFTIYKQTVYCNVWSLCIIAYAIVVFCLVSLFLLLTTMLESLNVDTVWYETNHTYRIFRFPTVEIRSMTYQMHLLVTIVTWCHHSCFTQGILWILRKVRRAGKRRCVQYLRLY